MQLGRRGDLSASSAGSRGHAGSDLVVLSRYFVCITILIAYLTWTRTSHTTSFDFPIGLSESGPPSLVAVNFTRMSPPTTIPSRRSLFPSSVLFALSSPSQGSVFRERAKHAEFRAPNFHEMFTLCRYFFLFSSIVYMTFGATSTGPNTNGEFKKVFFDDWGLLFDRKHLATATGFFS